MTAKFIIPWTKIIDWLTVVAMGAWGLLLLRFWTTGSWAS